jgi:hypothetical protein
VVNINSLTFDVGDSVLQQETESYRLWSDSSSMAHRLEFNSTPPSWPFDLRNKPAAEDFYGHECTSLDGAMLEMDVVTVGGLELLRGLFKYRAPIPGSLAMYYVGILWLPFMDCCFQINIEAMEHGATGAREAAVAMIELNMGMMPPRQADRTVALGSVGELFDHLRSNPVQQLSSDQANYDHLLPNHPLSRVRSRLVEVTNSINLNMGGKKLKPFRFQRGWGFLG